MNLNDSCYEFIKPISIIVGSRCGGFDFYAKQKNHEDMLWLGCSEKSDLDIYINKSNVDLILFESKLLLDRRNFHEFKSNVRHGFEFPFFKKGKLYTPEDKTYLSLAIRKKMKLSLKKRCEMENTPFEIYDKNKNYVSTILFKPIPRIN